MRRSPGSLRARPVQARSQDTLQRVLDATELLLEERRFEDLSIRQILAASEVSVGSFYARFRSKEDLLPFLYASYSRDIARRMSGWLAPDRWEGKDLRTRIGELVGLAVRNYRARRGLLRTVALLARSKPRELAPWARRERLHQYRAAERLLLECRAEIRHPDPALAVRVGMLFTLAACRDQILFSDAPHPASVKIGVRRLADELARALYAYLVAPGSA